LLLVHFSLRAQPMPTAHPLDVDTGLPLPEVAQASTVFSLTALFGAYLGIYLILGVPALAGLATGTVLGLFGLRAWIAARRSRTFEAFLFSVFDGPRGNATVFALGVAATQCAYAVSELLILRELTHEALGLRADHATLAVMGLAIIGYFYVLFGGYMAVFRTDVLQFALVAAMAIICLAVAPPTALLGGVSLRLVPRAGYWPLPWGTPGVALYAYHFGVGVVMGLGFLLASPDAWKRVYLVTVARRRPGRRFVVFALVGIAPFAALVPLAALTPALPDGPVRATAMFAALRANGVLFVALALGLVASFLSAFNSAVLAGVHVGLMLQRHQRRVPREIARFHWLMITCLLSVCLLFTALHRGSNAYLLANLLLGPYAAIAGVQAGSRGAVARLPDGSVLWIMAVALAAWFIYVTGAFDLLGPPTTSQINTVPAGVGIFFATALVCLLARRAGRRHART
jgi:Na+/proline symporter